MATLLRVPEVAAGATEVVVSEWLVDEGADVTNGAALVALETEKAIVEVMAEAGGVLLRQLVDAGSTIAVGAPLVLVGTPSDVGADVEALLVELGVQDKVADHRGAGGSRSAGGSRTGAATRTGDDTQRQAHIRHAAVQAAARRSRYRPRRGDRHGTQWPHHQEGRRAGHDAQGATGREGTRPESRARGPRRDPAAHFARHRRVHRDRALAATPRGRGPPDRQQADRSALLREAFGTDRPAAGAPGPAQ